MYSECIESSRRFVFICSHGPISNDPHSFRRVVLYCLSPWRWHTHACSSMQVVQLLFLLLIGTVVYPLIEHILDDDYILRTYVMYDNVVVSEF